MTNQELLKMAVLMGEQFYSETAEIVSVDTEKRTCTVKILTTDCKCEGVHLQALEADTTGLFIKPAVGSMVLIGFTAKNHAVVFLYSEIEEYILKIGENTITMNAQGFRFNDGLMGGLVKIDVLVAWMAKVAASLNTFAGLLSVATPPNTYDFNTVTIKQSLENPKVKHG